MGAQLSCNFLIHRHDNNNSLELKIIPIDNSTSKVISYVLGKGNGSGMSMSSSGTTYTSATAGLDGGKR